jgi:hypothetical protein
MRDQVFMAAAPPLAVINRCSMPDNLLPGGRAATWTSIVDTGLLCLFGFGENETVRYQVMDAAGEMAVSGEGTQDKLGADALPSLKVSIGIGDRAPGKWTVNAAAPSGDLRASFDVQARTEDGKPAVVLALAGGQSQFKLGQSIGIAAYGLPETAAPQLGVYRVLDESSEGRDLRLHEAATLEPDAGAAFIALTLDSGYEPGEYCLVFEASPEFQPTAAPSALGAARCFEVIK